MVQGVDLSNSCAKIVPKVYKYTQKYNIFLMSEKKNKGPRRPTHPDPVSLIPPVSPPCMQITLAGGTLRYIYLKSGQFYLIFRYSACVFKTDSHNIVTMTSCFTALHHVTCWKRADAAHGRNKSSVLIIWLLTQNREKSLFSAIYDLCPYITRHNCLFLHSFRFG